MKELIYQKRYDKLDMAEADEMIDKMAEESFEQRGDDEESLLKKEDNYSESVYVPIPNREKRKREFIISAINASQLYELDIRITRALDHISVDFSFDFAGFMRELKKTIDLADNISFFSGVNDRDITISLDFYTHYYFSKSGDLISPKWL